jgi:hypothetical protein
MMMKLNSLARALVIGLEGGAGDEDGVAGAGVGEGAAGVDVLVVSSSEIRRELKKGMPLEVQKQSQKLRRSLRTPWINRSCEA